MKIRNNPRFKRAFTLVELLVVIAIIATLATFVVFGIGRAKKGANAAKLTNQMKQIYTGLNQLSEEGVDTGNHNPGSFPPHSGTLDDNQGTDFIWWDLVAEQLNIAERDNGKIEWSEPYSETIFQNPLSEHKLGGNRKEYLTLYGRTKDTKGSFAINGELSDQADPGADSDQVFVLRQSKLEDPTNTIYFAESDDAKNREGYYFDGMVNAPQGNYKDQVRCCMCSGEIRIFPNAALKESSKFEFLTAVDEKNYNNQP
ncbi:MAG: type II secretion system protein [Akkermansiaceae bacterium]